MYLLTQSHYVGGRQPKKVLEITFEDTQSIAPPSSQLERSRLNCIYNGQKLVAGMFPGSKAS